MSTSSVERVPGYYVDPLSGAWSTLPWPGDRTLPYSHPDRTSLLLPSLAPELFRWARENLVHYLTGKPWEFTPGQRRFLMLWYSVDVETGRWMYRRFVKRGSKGTGKDPLLGAWMHLEFLGPTQIADIDGDRVIGKQHAMPLVQVAANSEAQALDVLRIANAMLPQETRDAYGIDVGSTRTQLDNGGRFEVLTSSESSAEGDPTTAGGINESHHMKSSNGGHRLFGVVRRNVGKSPRDIQARLGEFTNGHEEGADSIAEQSFKAWQAQVSGKTVGKRDILYDSVEALPGTDIYDQESRRAGLAAAYSDAPWADPERLEDEVLDPSLSVSEALRFYFNLIAANEESWVEPAKFDAMGDPAVVVADGEPVALFLDCSKSQDSTALIGCRITDGHVFTLRVWQRPPGKLGESWRVPRKDAECVLPGDVSVDAEVRSAKARFKVWWFGADPSPATDDTAETNYWLPLIDEWHQDFGRLLPIWATPGAKGHSVKFDMRTSQFGSHDRNRAFVEMATTTAQAIDETTEQYRAFTHDADPTLLQHVHNARRHPTQWGTSLGKENRNSSRLVDAAVTMVGARLGRQIVLNSGKFKTGQRTKARAVVYR